MRVVLDTNVLLVSIPTKSMYRIIFNALIDGTIELALSNDILTEYHEIIAEKTNGVIAQNIGQLLVHLPNVFKTEIHYKWHLIKKDADDNKFVDCAIAGNADYLVTNDRHFRILSEIDFPKITVISINEFVEILSKSP
ncbi:MAG: putative toxin-antitoxin system toxin component, PIN family [Calditrichaeota bacterium]|nr:putative toxin-antitoxin system toxin component, PIN family [Calditrichota bacterium]